MKLQTGFSEKIENVEGKCIYQCPVSVMLTYDFIKTGFYHGYFSGKVLTFPTAAKVPQGQLSLFNRINIVIALRNTSKIS